MRRWRVRWELRIATFGSLLAEGPKPKKHTQESEREAKKPKAPGCLSKRLLVHDKPAGVRATAPGATLSQPRNFLIAIGTIDETRCWPRHWFGCASLSIQVVDVHLGRSLGCSMMRRDFISIETVVWL